MLTFDSEETLLSWKRKRRKTLIGFIVVGTVSGIDTSLVYSSLFLYLRDNVKTDQPKLWYGIILATFYISSALSAAFGGRWVDKTGKVRLYITITLALQFVGFLVYAIPYHPLNVLAGRFLCGVGESFTSIVTGEVLRVFTGKEANRAMLALAAVFPFGFILEPILSTVFRSVNFCIKKLEINHLNIVAVFMAFYVLVVIVIVNWTVSDCSNEFDLKNYQRQMSQNSSNEDSSNNNDNSNEETLLSDVSSDNNNNEETLLSDTTSNNLVVAEEVGIKMSSKKIISEQIPVKYILKTFLKNVDAALLLISSFVLTFTTHIAVGVLPLIVANEMDWGEHGMHILLAIYGVGGVITLGGMYVYNKTSRSIYYSCIVAVTCHILAYIFLFAFSVLQRNFTRDVTLMICFTVTSIFADLFEMFSAKLLLGALVPSKIQSFTEGLRDTMCTFGVICASIFSPFVFPYLTWLSVGMIVVSGVVTVHFLCRRNHLLNPDELSFDY